MSKKNPVVIVLETPRLLLTIDEAAQYLRVSRRTAKELQGEFARLNDLAKQAVAA